MYWFLKLFYFTLVIQLNVAVYTIPKDVNTEMNGSYTVMIFDENENIKPKYCYLQNQEFTYEIDLETPGVVLEPNNTVSGNETVSTSNILTSLGNGICGFKLDNFDANEFTSLWNISFYDQNNAYYYKTINVLNWDTKLENKTIEAKIGDFIDICCGCNIRNLLSCSLYNPSGKFVMSNIERECQFSVFPSNRFDFGLWTCSLFLINNMAPKKVYINVIDEDKEIVNLWQNQTNTHINFGCYTRQIIHPQICEIIRPDGEIFSLKEGFATDRYTSLSTRLSEKKCGMEIKKPLENFEKGLWRCALSSTLENVGGFINLTDETSTLPPPKPEIPQQIFVLESKETSITCKVPYSSSYCFIRSPNGTIYPAKNIYGPTVGLCKFTQRGISWSDNGTWSCGFAKENNEPDDVYTFQMIVLSTNYDTKPENAIVHSKTGDNSRLLCSSIGDFPIQYCRFQNNFGEYYHIDPEATITGRISYYGRGFKYGDCGIELEAVTQRDTGNWTCIARVGNNDRFPEVYSQIALVVDE